MRPRTVCVFSFIQTVYLLLHLEINMAIFEGTIQEFHHFIGPRIRNAVNNFTRSYRLKLNGICEDCGEKKELHSAHVHGSERRTIIEEVLENCRINGTIRCNIEEAETKILNAHLPIESCFKFICHSCHVAYDSNTEINTSSPGATTGNLPEKFEKISRIKLWAKRPHQDNHKIISAFLLLEEKGVVHFSELQNMCTSKENFSQFYVSKFSGHYPSMKTDGGNSHGKVFYDQNGIVNIWPRVRDEIRTYFGK